MIAILQWTTLAVCALVAIARIPSALRGENRSIFGVFVLVDRCHPAEHRRELPDHRRLARIRELHKPDPSVSSSTARCCWPATGSPRPSSAQGASASSLAPAGKAVLAVVGVATVVLFLLADTAGSATGLTGLSQGARRMRHSSNGMQRRAACTRHSSPRASCPPPSWPSARRLPWAVRLGALLLTVAFAAMAFGSFYPLIPREAGYLEAIINYTSVLCLALGLALVWISSLMAKSETDEPQMIAILQWTTLAVCSLAAIARIPSALRGENRSLFFIYAFMTAAILLSIEAPYLAVDSVLGGVEPGQPSSALHHLRYRLCPRAQNRPGLRRGRCPPADYGPARDRVCGSCICGGGGGLPDDGYGWIVRRT